MFKEQKCFYFQQTDKTDFRTCAGNVCFYGFLSGGLGGNVI